MTDKRVIVAESDHEEAHGSLDAVFEAIETNDSALYQLALSNLLDYIHLARHGITLHPKKKESLT